MELITIVLSALLGILAPAGLVIDSVAEGTIRDQLDDAEILAVRIDNTPNYQVLQGRVDRIRIAGRGLFPLEGVRVDTLDIEVENLALDPSRLQDGDIELEEPVDAGIHLILKQDDLNRAFQSPEVQEILEELSFDLAGASAQQDRYEFVNPQVVFLEDQRIRFQVDLVQTGRNRPSADNQLTVRVESGLQRLSAYQLQLVDPEVLINDEAFPSELVEPLITGLNRRLDLRRLEDSGLTARILEFEVNAEGMAIALILRVDPSFQELELSQLEF